MGRGGGTSYLIKTDKGKAFLKIKHKDVTVESKLEQEKNFSLESCLEHEYHMLKKAKAAGVSVPKVIFYDEYKEFQFLATEFIEDSLENVLEKNSVEQLLKLWEDLESNVRKLFENGLVHSDIHEYNIRCLTSEEIVLIDFEECRELYQDCCFTESLDYAGSNGISCLGEFPLWNKQKYSVHTNSLARMRQVFKEYVAKETIKYVKECNYDSSNGICVSIDHGKSEKTYQPIKNKFFEISGQRGNEDKRALLIEKLCDSLFCDNQFTFIDVGSNNGLFCRELSKYFKGECRCIGLEGFPKFNILARGLAFLEDCQNVEYYDFLCGEDDLSVLKLDAKCFITICSVWHHIQKKEVFLEQLRKMDIAYILFELAVQEECYGGHSWQTELNSIKEKLGFEGQIEVGHSLDYDRPLILISKEIFSEDKVREINAVLKSVYKVNLSDRIRKLFK